MTIHLLCLTSSGGVPIFNRKKGDTDSVSLPQFHNHKMIISPFIITTASILYSGIPKWCPHVLQIARHHAV